MDWRKIYRRLSASDKAGLYVTVIFHLTVIIVLAISRLTTIAITDNAFLMDFSREEEKERLEEEQAFREEISRRLDSLLGYSVPARPEEEVRNIAVDASEPLKDDRGTDAEALRRDAENLRQKLSAGRAAIEDDAGEETVDLGKFEKRQDNAEEMEYRGPSVVSYSLDGRKASRLSIPAYRCMGGGEVTVIITVDPHGNVIDAKVHDAVSSSDRCLREFAIRAAKLSRFSVLSPDRLRETPRQKGEIVYRFIAQ